MTARLALSSAENDELVAARRGELSVEAAIVFMRVVNCRDWAQATPHNLRRLLAGLNAIPRQASESLWSHELTRNK